MPKTNEAKPQRTESDWNTSEKSGKRTFDSFFNSIERQLNEHPQMGAMILDGVVMACEKLSELLKEFQEKVSERKDQIRQKSSSGKGEKEDRTSH